MGLVKGDAKISGYNTVLTAQADELSALNRGKPVSEMTADLFREFDWSSKVSKLVQVAFPGFFPDMTRYQAEADQAQAQPGTSALETQRDDGCQRPGRELAQLAYQFLNNPVERRWSARCQRGSAGQE